MCHESTSPGPPTWSNTAATPSGASSRTRAPEHAQGGHAVDDDGLRRSGVDALGDGNELGGVEDDAVRPAAGLRSSASSTARSERTSAQGRPWGSALRWVPGTTQRSFRARSRPAGKHETRWPRGRSRSPRGALPWRLYAGRRVAAPGPGSLAAGPVRAGYSSAHAGATRFLVRTQKGRGVHDRPSIVERGPALRRRASSPIRTPCETPRPHGSR